MNQILRGHQLSFSLLILEVDTPLGLKFTFTHSRFTPKIYKCFYWKEGDIDVQQSVYYYDQNLEKRILA